MRGNEKVYVSHNKAFREQQEKPLSWPEKCLGTVEKGNWLGIFKMVSVWGWDEGSTRMDLKV